MQSKPDDPDVCPLCRQGNFFQREEEWRFLQWTDKGSVHCQVTIALAVCSQCGFKTWDEAAERRINEAVRQEYEKLP
jgi:hypothetical protein